MTTNVSDTRVRIKVHYPTGHTEMHTTEDTAASLVASLSEPNRVLTFPDSRTGEVLHVPARAITAIQVTPIA